MNTNTPHDLQMLPHGTQVKMIGDDWISDRDRKTIAKTEEARKKAAIACAKKLESAADALNDFMAAANECNDYSSVRRADDSRMLLMQSITEYASLLNSVFGK